MSEPILIATLLRPQGDTGVQTHFNAFLNWAGEKNLSMRLVTPYDSPRWQVYPMFALRRLVDPLNKLVSVWWYRHWHALFLRLALCNALADGRPCTVYAQCPLSAAAALQARTAGEQKVIMVVHFNVSQADEWVEKGMIKTEDVMYRAIRNLEATVFQQVDGLVFVSEFIQQELAARIPASAAIPYRIVPNFLRDPGLVSERKNFEADLICIGTLESRKNQRYALEIIAAAKKLGRTLNLTIVGDGPDRQMLRSLAIDYGIEQQVTFAGFVKNAASLMPLHRAFLHTARMESFGIVLIEAMAHGLPVFAPAVGGIPEVFTHEREGRFIPLDDAGQAAEMIIQWLDSEQTMQVASMAARDRFLACFEAAAVAARLAFFLKAPHRSEAAVNAPEHAPDYFSSTKPDHHAGSTTA